MGIIPLLYSGGGIGITFDTTISAGHEWDLSPDSREWDLPPDTRQWDLGAPK